jgi:hypothetical protein
MTYNYLQLISLSLGRQIYIAWKLILYNKDLRPDVHYHNISYTNECHLASVTQYYGRTKIT